MGWEAAWDIVRKKWYYQDRNLGTSTWQMPKDSTLELPRVPPSEAPESVPDLQDLPAGWHAAWDVRYRHWYYYNYETAERTWTQPRLDRGAPAARSTIDAAAKGDVEMLQQPAAKEGEARSQGFPARGATWDPAGFLRRLGEAKQTRNKYAVKGVFREVSENNYDLRHSWPVPRTVLVKHADCLQVLDQSEDASSLFWPSNVLEVTFSSMTTADAMLYFARERGAEKVCGLNFANGSQVGGGYKNGAQAQEEDLCRRMPCLFTSLNNAKRDGYYPFGPPTCQSVESPAGYSDVLWTPDVALARGDEASGFDLLPKDQQVSVSLVAAAAPNLRFAQPPELFDRDLMYNTIESIFVTPRMKQPEVTTLLLGAWGCGAFGGDPHEVSELFCKALRNERLSRLYKEVHFAIPSSNPEDKNIVTFRNTLKKHGFNVQELRR